MTYGRTIHRLEHLGRRTGSKSHMKHRNIQAPLPVTISEQKACQYFLLSCREILPWADAFL
jgi:hypothetical protein